MAKPVIIITGASGFLGSQLVQHFAKKDWRVRALVRQPKAHQNTKNITYLAYSLAEPVDAKIFKGADYLVHAAYVKQSRQQPDALQLNLRAAERLLAASRKHHLKKNIFISSMSAHQDAISVYGRQKLAIEQLFDQPHDICLRPGLIIGAGGIVQNMVGFMKSKHLVPLVAGGKQPLQIIRLDDVVLAVDRALTKPAHGTLTIAHPTILTYRSFYGRVARQLGIRVLFVPVPYYALLGLLNIATLLPLPLDISSDNLRGLKKLRSANTRKDLDLLSIKLESLDAYLKKALAALV